MSRYTSRDQAYALELAELVRLDGLDLNVTNVINHPNGELVVVESRIIGPDGNPYDSCGIHLRAGVSPVGKTPWSYGVPFPRSLTGELGGALTSLSERKYGE